MAATSVPSIRTLSLLLAVTVLTCWPAHAQAQVSHLVISEIGYDAPNEAPGNSSEFIEIYNPTTVPIVLGSPNKSFFLSDLPFSYFLVTDDPAELVNNGTQTTTFCYEFPIDTTLPPGGVLVIAADRVAFLNDRGFFGDINLFTSQPGQPQLLDAYDMVGHHSSASVNLSLSNTNLELVALYFWDRASDVVVDHDLVGYNNVSGTLTWPFISRAAALGSYLPDACTGVLALHAVDPDPAPLDSLSITRVLIAEMSESTSGGNGLGGHDETTEDLTATFNTLEASPGVVSALASGVTPAAGAITVEVVDITPTTIQSGYTLDLGPQVLGGASSSVTLRVTNVGAGPVNLAVPVLGGADSADFTVDTSAFTPVLTADASTVFSVALTPVSAGPKSAWIELTHDAFHLPSPFVIALQGFAVAIPELQVIIDATELVSLAVGQDATALWQLHNSGSAPLTIMAYTFTGANAPLFSAAGPMVPVVLAPATQIPLLIRYSPQSAVTVTAGIAITSNTGGVVGNVTEYALVGRVESTTPTPDGGVQPDPDAGPDAGLDASHDASPDADTTPVPDSGADPPLDGSSGCSCASTRGRSELPSLALLLLVGWIWTRRKVKL